MAVLTWREVSAPNFSSVNQAQGMVGDSLSNAAKILQSSVAAYADQRSKEDTANFMGQIAAGTPLDQIQGVNPAYLDPAAFQFLLNKQKVDEATALGYARLAQGGARGGRKGTGGAASGDVIPVAPGASDGNYLTPDNQVIQGTVTNVGTNPAAQKGKTQIIPVAPTVTAPNQPAAQSIVPTEEFAPMPSDGPLRSDAATVTPNATQLFADATATYGAPVAPDLRPTAGPLRGAPVKGNDGAAQVFPALTQDLGNAANAAAQGDWQAANEAIVGNQRTQNNLTGTNVLTVLDKNMERAKTGFELNSAQRKDSNEARSDNDRAIGRSAGIDAVQGALDEASALAALPTDLTPDQRKEAVDQIKLAGRTGGFSLGDPNRPTVTADGAVIPPGNNPVVQRENLIASMTSTPEGAKNVQEQLSTPEGAAKFNASIDAALASNVTAGRDLQADQLQHNAVLQKYDLDRNADPDVPFIKDFVKNLKSDADAGQVAKEVMKNPRFEGSGVNTNDMASLIERTAASAKVSPAIAGGMVANSLRGSQFGDWVKSFVYNKADLTYNDEKLQRLMDKARDPVTGKPKDDLLNEISALNQSDQERDNFNNSWEQLVKAQNQYDKDVGQNALKDNDQTRKLVSMSKRAFEAAKEQYLKDKEKFTAVGGVARQNRGEPAQPGQAIPTVAPQQGPRAAPGPSVNEVLQRAINGGMTITTPPPITRNMFGF